VTQIRSDRGRERHGTAHVGKKPSIVGCEKLDGLCESRVDLTLVIVVMSL
jgi:hypothetical protein